MLTEEELEEMYIAEQAEQDEIRKNIQGDLVKAVQSIRAAQHYLDETERLESIRLDGIYRDLIHVKVALEKMVAEYENEH